MRGAEFRPRHFLWEMRGDVAVITLDRPEKKNPLTFDSYAELRDTFRALAACADVKAVVLTGAGGNFCSGGDVLEIIGPLTERDMKGLLAFTRMTGDLVKAIRACPQPVIAAVDGVCVGAGACLAMASDLRLGTPEAKTAFLFVRVGLAGCDMGACALLPRIIGQGRAAELLLTGRSMGAEEGERWGFFNRLCPREQLLDEALDLAAGARRGADLRPRDDQDDAQPGVEHEPRGGDRGRGPGPGDLHADRGFPARLPRVRRETAARVRGQLNAALAMPDRSYLAWPFFEERHRALAAEVERLATGTLADLDAGADDVDATCRMLVGARRGGLLRHAVPAAYGGIADGSTCARSASCARRSRASPASPTSPSPCRGSAAARSRCSAPRSSAAPICRRSRDGRKIAAFALSEPRGRLRRRGDRDDRRAATAPASS